MPRSSNASTALETTNRILSNPTYKALIDPNLEANKWIQSNPNVIGNISKVLLTGFYIIYKQKLNANIENLDKDLRESSCDILKETILKNENEFLNSFNNIMVSTPQKIEYLTSAIETSKVLLESADESSEPMGTLEGIFDASNHLFNRLNVYQLMPLWGATLLISYDAIQAWRSKAWDNLPYSDFYPYEDHAEHDNPWI